MKEDMIGRRQKYKKNIDIQETQICVSTTESSDQCNFTDEMQTAALTAIGKESTLWCITT